MTFPESAREATRCLHAGSANKSPFPSTFGPMLKPSVTLFAVASLLAGLALVTLVAKYAVEQRLKREHQPLHQDA